MWVLLEINSFTQAGVQTKGSQTHWWPWNSVGVCHQKILVRWRYTSLGICGSLRFNKSVVTQNRDWKWLLWVGKSLECSKNTILTNSPALRVWVTYRISPTSNSLNKIEQKTFWQDSHLTKLPFGSFWGGRHDVTVAWIQRLAQTNLHCSFPSQSIVKPFDFMSGAETSSYLIMLDVSFSS